MLDLEEFDEVTDEVVNDYNLTSSSSSSSSSSSRRKHYFLMRLPYDADITDLDNITLDKRQIEKFINDKKTTSGVIGKSTSTKGRTPSRKEGRSNEYYAINLEPAEPYNTFRPILKDEASNSLKLGDPFTGVLSVTPAVDQPAVTVPTEITIPTAYSKKFQVEGLKVHAVPMGSLSTTSEIDERKRKFKAIFDVVEVPSPTPKKLSEKSLKK